MLLNMLEDPVTVGTSFVRSDQGMILIIYMENLSEIPDEQLDLAHVLLKRSHLEPIDTEKSDDPA